MTIPLLYLLFVLSGAAGLFYESVWSRYLSLFVGHGAYAQVIVLVIFLGGMALGAGLISRRSERLRDPLYGYAMIELAIGIVGLVFHDLIYVPVTGWAYDSLFPALGGGVAVGLAKWTLAGMLILPQSILLGATFPLMSAGVIRRAADRPGRVLSLLYFTNSLGAAAGVLLAGFYLVKLAGLPGTLLAAAILNLLVGLAALFVAKLSPPSESVAEVKGQVEASAGTTDATVLALRPLSRLLLLAASATALASFVYEVAWIRLLSLVLGSATHSFELMLSAFILGLSLGALWIRSRMERIDRPLAVLAAIQVIMGGFAILSLALYSRSFGWMADLMAAVGRTEQGYLLYNLLRYGLCLIIMLPATFCAGMTLPLITRTLLVAGAGERAIGAVYSWNTFGSILGVSAASLLLIPWLGLKATLIFGGVLDSLVGVAIVFTLIRHGAPLRRLAVISLTFSVVVPLFVAVLVQLDRAVMTGGVFRSGQVGRQGDMEYYQDGRTATISMAKTSRGRMNISTNGKPDGSIDLVWMQRCTSSDTLKAMEGDDPTQVLLPLVLLSHKPAAKSVAVIGHGTGMSSHSLLASTAIESLVTIEIEPAIVKASRLYYPANRRVFDDPRAVHAFTDAKAYFAASNSTFDLIMSEPSNPWVSGVSGLFTSEFYARVKRYLAPGGVLGQWLHTYELSDDLVLTILGAVHRNFADYRIYAVNSGDLLLIAVKEGQVPRPDWAVFDLPGVRSDLCHFHPVTRGELNALSLTSRAALAPLLDKAPEINSDFFPVLDLGAERARFTRASATGINGLHAGVYDFAGPEAGPLVPGDSLSVSALVQIPRVRSLLASRALRAGLPPLSARDSAEADRAELAQAAIQRWVSGLKQRTAPNSWMVWTREFSAAFTEWHGGTRRWVDSEFIGAIRRWFDQVDAPAEARAAVDLREHLARGQLSAAVSSARLLIAEAAASRLWIERDKLRDGAVLALLAAGDPEAAKGVLSQQWAQTSLPDFRIRLLQAYVAQVLAPDSVTPLPRP